MQLLEFIKDKQITQEQAAKELGVPQATVSYWVRGVKIPTPDNMKKIVEWSKGEVQPNDFYGISHEAFMKEMDDFEKEMDADFRRINHLDEKADINQILEGGQGE